MQLWPSAPLFVITLGFSCVVSYQLGGQPLASPRIGETPNERPAAIRAALDWLRRHQAEAGFWSGSNFAAQCEADTPPVAPGKGCAEGRGYPDYDVGLTGLAILAFLEGGHAPTSDSPFREPVNRAYHWLLEQQYRSVHPRRSGAFRERDGDSWIYNQAIGTLALASLLERTQRTDLVRPVSRAIECCIRCQNRGLGWHYGERGSDNNTSTTAWMARVVIAGQRCADAGLLDLSREKLTESLAGATLWLNRMTTGGSFNRSYVTGYRFVGDLGSNFMVAPGKGAVRFDAYFNPSAMTAAACWVRLSSGLRVHARAVDGAVARLMRYRPEWRPPAKGKKSTINFYYWLWGTYALKRVGGEEWRQWQDALDRTLLSHQRSDGCAKGSWDPIGEWGVPGGRVFSTAVGATVLGLSASAQ